MPTKKTIKRPRGRPPKEPSKRRAYEQRTVRFRHDGAVWKRPKRVKVDHVEAWIEAHQAEHWAGAGRPPKGTVSLVAAVMQRFDVSRRTVQRLITAINRRRARQSAQVRGPLSPLEAGLLAALANSYRNSVPGSASGAMGKTASAGINGSHVISLQHVTHKRATADKSVLQVKIDPQDLRQGLLRALSDYADEGLLREAAGVIDRRLPARQGVRESASAERGRQLDAVGLRTVPGAARPKSPLEEAKAALLECIDFYSVVAQPPEALHVMLDQVAKAVMGAAR